MPLPITAILDDLLASLNINHNAVLIAPPGAGKTTMVAPALMAQPWNKGQILLLSPRRLAARMAATYMAQNLGEDVGETIGYTTRSDSKLSAENKIIVMTEGIFRNKIIADPMLEGISTILFDEVHERSLNSDFGLALALEAQKAFRPELRLIAMSATLDGDRFTHIMNDASLFQSEGKSYPLNLHYIGRRAEKNIEEDLALALRDIVREDKYSGDILVFLPGLREIDLLADIVSLGDAVVIHKLHGSMEPQAQRDALKPDKQGRRKIILATNIAETSLTIDGVRIVVDSGLVRRARYDRQANVNRLVTEKSSLASATQRAGRAARQGQGHAFRLWQEAANGGLIPFDPPEIIESDLTGLVLDCALWGEYEPQKLSWLDAPPLAGLKQARKQLEDLSLLDSSGHITQYGKCAAQLPLPPHLANMLLRAKDKVMAAKLAILLQDHNLGGRNIDLATRFSRFNSDKNIKSKTAHKIAERWADLGRKSASDIDHKALITDGEIGALLAMAYPERLAKRQDQKGEIWLSAGGRRYYLDSSKETSLSQSDWLAIANVQGSANRARIMSAAMIDYDSIENIMADHIHENVSVMHDAKTDRIEAGYVRTLGAITLAKGHSDTIDDDMIAQALLASVMEHGLDLLPWKKASENLRKRAQYAGLEELSDDALKAALNIWLLPIMTGKRRLAHIEADDLHQALELRLGWDQMQHIKKIAPTYFLSPDGSKYNIDYDNDPMVECRVQALFGLSQHPTIGMVHVPLLLSLTSPAGRPIQTTRNLPEFWQGSWHDVAKEMRGRYPKHHWPDDPASARASLKTKKRQNL